MSISIVNTKTPPAGSQAIGQVDTPQTPIPADGRFLNTSTLIPEGILRHMYGGVRPLIERVFGFHELWRMHQNVIRPPYTPEVISGRVHEYLGVEWSLDSRARKELAELAGPVVLTANHPCGGIEFFALVRLLEAVRPGGWRFLANELICKVTGFEEHFIPLDPLGRGAETARRNQRGLMQAFRYLRSGGMLGLFPAGRVSHRHPEMKGAVADRDWTDQCVALAERTNAHLVCLHIDAANSSIFLKVPPAWPRVRALMLCRELIRPKTRRLPVRLAAVHPPASVFRLARGPNGAARLRADCYLAADAALPRPTTANSRCASVPPVAGIPSVENLETELFGPKVAHLLRHGRFDLYFLRGDTAPQTLRALGSTRETTFRAAGQGTGSACDFAPEDEHYHHLLLWDSETHRLAGAYRVGIIQRILAERGPTGLYLNHVFKIDSRLYDRLGPAFELSRSFVHPDYQRDRDALAGLWKGLGAAAVREGAGTFFGSVTISNAHHPASRALLVEYLRQNNPDTPELCSLVHARKPFAPETRYHRLIVDAYRGEPIGALSPLVRRIEGNARDIPPLMRYYCGLGARFLAYHVEASFQDALYCLLRVELAKIPEAYKKRFLPADIR